MIQIRNVPEEVHSILKARAAREGMSLSDFLKQELARSVAKPTLKEWLEQTKSRKPIRTSKSGAEMIREIRDSR